MNRKISPIGALLVLFLVVVVSAPVARATDAVIFELYYGPPQVLYVRMECDTPGAIIFYTVGYTGYATEPTHTGSTPGSGTIKYTGQTGVPYGQTRYYAAVAWTPGEGDSDVMYFEQHNPNW